MAKQPGPTRGAVAPVKGGHFTPGFAWYVVGVLTVVAVLSGRALLFPPDAPRPPERTRAELVILTGKDESTDESTQGQRHALIKKWNDEHPDKPARLEEISGNTDEQHSQMVGQAQEGEARVDIYNLDVIWTLEFATAGYIRPLDSVDAKGFLEGPLSTCEFDGRYWALPFNTDAGLLYYHTSVKDLLPDTFPPTPKEVKAMKTFGQPDLMAGMVNQMDDYEGLTITALEAIWAAGGEVLDENGSVVIDQPEAQEGLKRLADALLAKDPDGNRYPDSRPAVDPASRGYKEQETFDAFRRGEAVMMRNWPVYYGRLRSAEPPVTNFDVTTLPVSVLGGQNLAIASDSPNPQDARELIDFLTNEENQRQLFLDGGFAPTRAAVYADQEVKDKRPYAETLLSALKNAKQRPRTPNYPLFSRVFQDIVIHALDHDGQLKPRSVARLTDALQGRLI